MQILFDNLLRLINHKLQLVIYEPKQFESIFLEMRRTINFERP